MRKGMLAFALGLGIVLLAVGTRAGAAVYGRAEFKIQEREHPLWHYKDVCEKDVVPRFVAELKRQNPSLDEQELAGKIAVRVNVQRNQFVIYVEAEHAKTGIAHADRLAQMAFRQFIAQDQAERIRSLERIIRDEEELKATIEPLEEEVTALEKDPRLEGAEEKRGLLTSRVKAYRDERLGAKAEYSQLEAKLELLSKKAAQARDAVSVEEVALLQQAARELAMQVDDAARLRQEKEIESYKIIVKQKERELEQIHALRKKDLVSEEEVMDAEDEVRLARNDFEVARMEMEQLAQSLNRVREDLAKAKHRLAETGGLQLTAVIAENILRCETDMAGMRVKILDLKDKMEECEKDIAEIDSLGSVLEGRRAELGDPQKRLRALEMEEDRLENRMISTRGVGETPDRYIRTGSVPQIEAEQVETYDVIGEVKEPGPQVVQGETTVLQAIASAGGFTDDADPARVIVIRRSTRRDPRRGGPSMERHVIDCGAILEGESPDEFAIESGDMVIVPREPPMEVRPEEPPRAEEQGVFRVVGAVRKPGEYSFQPKTTVLEAIKRAGGFTDYALKGRVTVIRVTDGSSEKEMVDCKAILEGESPDDFAVRPGDIVVVRSLVGPEGM